MLFFFTSTQENTKDRKFQVTSNTTYYCTFSFSFLELKNWIWNIIDILHDVIVIDTEIFDKQIIQLHEDIHLRTQKRIFSFHLPRLSFSFIFSIARTSEHDSFAVNRSWRWFPTTWTNNAMLAAYLNFNATLKHELNKINAKERTR